MKITIFYFFIILVLSSAVPAFAAAQTFKRNLYCGLTNDTDVQALQQFLTTQGDYNGPTTGNFFSLTRLAVKKFQLGNAITPASGYFGAITRAAVNRIVSQQNGTLPQSQSVLQTSSTSIGMAASNQSGTTIPPQAPASGTPSQAVATANSGSMCADIENEYFHSLYPAFMAVYKLDDLFQYINTVNAQTAQAMQNGGASAAYDQEEAASQSMYQQVEDIQNGANSVNTNTVPCLSG